MLDLGLCSKGVALRVAAAAAMVAEAVAAATAAAAGRVGGMYPASKLGRRRDPPAGSRMGMPGAAAPLLPPRLSPSSEEGTRNPVTRKPDVAAGSGGEPPDTVEPCWSVASPLDSCDDRWRL